MTPCQNGGSCINGTCLCPPGYTGPFCRIKGLHSPLIQPSFYDLLIDWETVFEHCLFVFCLHSFIVAFRFIWFRLCYIGIACVKWIALNQPYKVVIICLRYIAGLDNWCSLFKGLLAFCCSIFVLFLFCFLRIETDTLVLSNEYSIKTECKLFVDSYCNWKYVEILLGITSLLVRF